MAARGNMDLAAPSVEAEATIEPTNSPKVAAWQPGLAPHDGPSERVAVRLQPRMPVLRALIRRAPIPFFQRWVTPR